MIQTWVLHYLQIIGEACRGLSAAFRERYADGPWAEIIAMRNILVHHYFGVDRDAVWAVVEKNLPELKPSVEAILGELGSRA